VKLNRRTIDKVKGQNTTVITEGVQLKGKVRGPHHIILYGEIEGNIELKGTLLVGATGRIKGKIDVHNVIIEGDVEGTVTTTEKVEIRDGGRYRGDIIAKSILVSEMAMLKGNVKIKTEGKEPSVQKFTEKRGK
jgi:cytoskeletal protein CcmA (bactofilin family)